MFRIVSWILALIVSIELAAGLAFAATVETKKTKSGINLIFVEGPLEFGDEKEFARNAINLDDALVIFQSPGGNLRAGLEIGRAIRLKGFSTYVADNEYCASACAIAWLGGRTRMMSRTAKVGFHGAYLERNGEKITTSAGNALVGAYLSQLGLSESAIIYITQANPSSMAWLTLTDAQKVGISVEPFDLNNGQPANASRQSGNPNSRESKPLLTLDAMAQKFFVDLQASWSQPNSQALTELRSVYPPSLWYYGKILSSEDVMKEKIAFAQRWENRNYKASPGSIKTDCNGSDFCTISGIVEWRAFSPQRNVLSTGTAEVEIGVQFTSSGPLILKENSKVLQRQVTR